MDAAAAVTGVGLVVHARQPGEGVGALHPPRAGPTGPAGKAGAGDRGLRRRQGSGGQHGGLLPARAAAAAPVESGGLLLVVAGGVGVVVLPAGALHLGDLGVGGSVFVHDGGPLRGCLAGADLLRAPAGLFLEFGFVTRCVVAHDVPPFVSGVVAGTWTRPPVVVS